MNARVQYPEENTLFLTSASSPSSHVCCKRTLCTWICWWFDRKKQHAKCDFPSDVSLFMRIRRIYHYIHFPSPVWAHVHSYETKRDKRFVLISIFASVSRNILIDSLDEHNLYIIAFASINGKIRKIKTLTKREKKYLKLLCLFCCLCRIFFIFISSICSVLFGLVVNRVANVHVEAKRERHEKKNGHKECGAQEEILIAKHKTTQNKYSWKP